jgi:hypothetical protein
LILIMNVREVAPSADCGAVLAGAQFADAYRIAIDGTEVNARRAAEKMFARGPRWAEALLALRNILVRPFGLKTSGEGEPASAGMIGLFPVVRETADRLIAGFNDRHLDFRVVVDVAPSGSGQEITATTLVKTHNWLGRVYLAIVLPFHRLIVRNMLQRAFTRSVRAEDRQ